MRAVSGTPGPGKKLIDPPRAPSPPACLWPSAWTCAWGARTPRRTTSGACATPSWRRCPSTSGPRSLVITPWTMRNTYEVAVWQAQHCRNTVNLPAQCAAAWAAHLSAMWGIRTDASRGRRCRRRSRPSAPRTLPSPRARASCAKDGSKNMAVIHEAVTKAWQRQPQRTEKGP